MGTRMEVVKSALLEVDGVLLEPHQLRDAIALAVHELLDAPDESTRRDVEYPNGDGEAITASIADPHTWDLATFTLKVKRASDTLSITAACEEA